MVVANKYPRKPMPGERVSITASDPLKDTPEEVRALDEEARRERESFEPVTRLLGNRVVVSIPNPEETTEGGIMLPEQSRQRKCCGVVTMVGNGVTEDIKVGDLVSFLPYGVVELPMEGIPQTIVEVADIALVSR